MSVKVVELLESLVAVRHGVTAVVVKNWNLIITNLVVQEEHSVEQVCVCVCCSEVIVHARI